MHEIFHCSATITDAFTPRLFVEGQEHKDGESIYLQEALEYQLLCIVDRARPAVNMRWLTANKGSDPITVDSSDDATTATYVTTDDEVRLAIQSELGTITFKSYLLHYNYLLKSY